MSLPAPDAEMRQEWLAAVHTALRSTTPRGKVLNDVSEPRAGCNYYSVQVQVGTQAGQRLLLNAAARLVASAWDERSAQVGPLDFCDVPASRAFIAAGFTVASQAALAGDLHPEDVMALSAEEQRDIAYHRPSCVGDVLFNWFD